MASHQEVLLDYRRFDRGFDDYRPTTNTAEAARLKRSHQVGASAGHTAARTTIETTEAVRAQLLVGAATDVEHTNTIFRIINKRRPRGKQLEICPAGAIQERLRDLTDDDIAEATEHLYADSNHPLMVVPALPSPITAEELGYAIEGSAQVAAASLTARPQLLTALPIELLTGYDERRADNSAVMLLETGHDPKRAGTRQSQLEELLDLRETEPGVDTAPILATAILSKRHNKNPERWEETYTRVIAAAEPSAVASWVYPVDGQLEIQPVSDSVVVPSRRIMELVI
jgi:hypothetical protein